jgi:hypothetical protein
MKTEAGWQAEAPASLSYRFFVNTLKSIASAIAW